MRTIDSRGALGQVSNGAVVFDGGAVELRDYVKGIVQHVIVFLYERLPRIVRLFVSAEKLSDLAGWAFDRAWPAYASEPPIPVTKLST